MLTRRRFLQVGMTGTLGLWYPRWMLNNNGGLTPEIGLFFTAQELPRLQKHLQQPVFASLRRAIEQVDRVKIDQLLQESALPEKRYEAIIPISRIAINQAFLGVVTGNEEALRQALDAVRVLLGFARWDYIIEGEEVIGLERASEATLAVSVVMDWLGELLTPEEKRAWLQALVERGIESCYRALYRMHYPKTLLTWKVDPLSGYFKFNPEPPPGIPKWPRVLFATSAMAPPLAALSLGMLVYIHFSGIDEQVQRWRKQLFSTVGVVHKLFASDGSFREGISRAAAATPWLARMNVALRRKAGLDYFDQVNWQGFVRFMRELSLATYQEPHGALFLGDKERAGGSAVAYWVARRARDPYAQWTAQERLKAHDVWSVIWYDEQVPVVKPYQKPHLWVSDLQWAVSRTGHTVEDLVVATLSGSIASPLRADRNALLVKAFGEPLVVTPVIKKEQSLFTSRASETFSTLLIDQTGQAVQEEEREELATRLLAYGERPSYHFWKSDASEAYRMVLPDIRSVTRSVFTLPDWPATIVVDKVQKASKASLVQARFFADNRDGAVRLILKEAEAYFQIARPHASLHAFVFSLGGVSIQQGVLPLPAEEAEQFPFVEVSTDTPSRQPFLISVLVPVPGGQDIEELGIEAKFSFSPDGTYLLTLKQGGRRLTCRIYDTAEAPEFERLKS